MKVEYKKLDKNILKEIKKNIKLDDILGSITQAEDTKEKVLNDMTSYLFNDDKIYMIARLDKELAFYIVKHVIIKEFFLMYWNQCNIKIEIIKNNDYPYYEIIKNITYPTKEELVKSYDNYIYRLLQITISFQGKGRDEIISIIKSVYQQIEFEETEKRGLLKRFM